MAKRTHKISAEVSLDTKDLKRGTDLSQREFNKLKSTFRGLESAEEKFIAKQKLLKKSLDTNTIDAKQYNEALKRLEAQYRRTGDAASTFNRKSRGGIRAGAQSLAGVVPAGVPGAGILSGIGGLSGGATAVGGVGALSVGIIKIADSSNIATAALGDFADRIGINAVALRGLQEAARESGATAEALNTGLQRMTRRIAEAARGGGAAATAIERLGINAQDLARMRPDEQFLAISDAIGSIDEHGERLATTVQIFDTEGASLLPALMQGSEVLKEYRSQFESAFSQKNIDNAREYLAATQELSTEYEKLKTVVAGLISPTLTNLISATSGALQGEFRGEQLGKGLGGLPGVGLPGMVRRGIFGDRSSDMRIIEPAAPSYSEFRDPQAKQATDQNTKATRQLTEAMRAAARRGPQSITGFGNQAGSFNRFVGN